MVKPDAAWIELLSARLHDRFETNLRKIGSAAGAGLHPIEIRVSAAPALDFADEPAVLRVLCGRAAALPMHSASGTPASNYLGCDSRHGDHAICALAARL